VSENDDRLNALPVKHLVQLQVPVFAAGGFKESTLAVVAGMIPFALAVLFKASISGWGSSVVDISNLGFSLFAISLATYVRIADHGRGRNFLLPLVVIGILQVGFALFYSGTFDQSKPSRSSIAQEAQYLDDHFSSPQTVDQDHLRDARDLLTSVSNDSHTPSITTYIVISLTGAASVLALYTLWSPVRPRRRASHD
jgi:hypothetical protein